MPDNEFLPVAPTALTFLGAAGTVTGSKYLLEWPGARILVDCGLFQGYKQLRLRNWAALPINPRDIDAVLLTHAHLDHSGYLPLLVKNGFSGRVYCTEATRDLCAILLPDSGHLQEKDAAFANRHGFSKHKPALPLYSQADAEMALAQFSPVPFGKNFHLPGGAAARFLAAGHILGAAIIELKRADRTIVFSGDLGRPNNLLLPDPTKLEHADYLIVESTYGDRTHDTRDPAEALAEIIRRTAARGGTIVIPSFAVGRAQEVLLHLWRARRDKRIPGLPIFLDSPMAIDATDLFSVHESAHKMRPADLARAFAVAGYVHTQEESRALDAAGHMPKVIISASGMATGGRVLHHLKAYAPDPRNTILFVGFQAAGTRGADMLAGAQTVKIHGEYVPVRAEVAAVHSLSAHADAGELISWLKQFRTAPRITFITHGEPGASEFVPQADRGGARLAVRGPGAWRPGRPGMSISRDAALVRDGHPAALKARQIGIDSHEEVQVFLHKDCVVARSEGFSSHARVLVAHNGTGIIAHLYLVTSDLVGCDEAGFSDSAWQRLGLSPGAPVSLSHAPPLNSMSAVRGKVYGRRFDAASQKAVISDIAAGSYSNIQLAAFITACAARPLDIAETRDLTQAMVDAGERLTWNSRIVADKHSVGGLPGNRTTPIVVAIAAACGLTIPKTSSRAITSPAGTADMMESLAPVDLDLSAMRRVVEREGGCLVWGGAMGLSPTDDILIRVERVLDLDAEGQLVASVLSKKIAAGATHVILDMPLGPTAKVRSVEAAQGLTDMLMRVGQAFDLSLRVQISDGSQPVGRGIGPALEAYDVLAVFQQAADAPADLRQRSLQLAGELLELAEAASEGTGYALAESTLRSGAAWRKFQAICAAQGGMRIPPVALHRHVVAATRSGVLSALDNRLLAKIAKLAGAPEDKAAGIALHVRAGDRIAAGQPLYTIHAESPGQLSYALNYAGANPGALLVAEE